MPNVGHRLRQLTMVCGHVRVGNNCQVLSIELMGFSGDDLFYRCISFAFLWAKNVLCTKTYHFPLGQELEGVPEKIKTSVNKRLNKGGLRLNVKKVMQFLLIFNRCCTDSKFKPNLAAVRLVNCKHETFILQSHFVFRPVLFVINQPVQLLSNDCIMT